MSDEKKLFIKESANKQEKRIIKHKLSITLSLVILTMAISAATARAQTVANGPYYAWPSWDQKLPCDSSANCPRFIVLANWSSAAVLDRETGLVWERSPATFTTQWAQGHTFCRGGSTGSRFGWRLPTINELFSLKDPAVTAAPFLPAGHPFTVQASDYWSANTFEGNTLSAWFIRLSVDNSPLQENKGIVKLHWCVRGGQSTDPQ
jgi:hypothetical protein